MKRDNQGRTLAKWRKAVREACSEARTNPYAVLPLLPEKYQEARIYYNPFARIGRYHGLYYLRLDGRVMRRALRASALARLSASALSNAAR